MRTVVGYHRYDTTAELLLLNKIWALQSLMTNYFGPQRELISDVRNGAKVIKKYDTPKTHHRRASDPDAVDQHDNTILADTYRGLNPAAIQTVTTSNKGPSHNQPPRPPLRAHPLMSQGPGYARILTRVTGPPFGFIVPGTG